MNEIEIRCKDDRLLVANWVRSTGNSPALATVIIHSATGVQRRYYQLFAHHLSEHSVDVLLWDARGIGDSTMLPVRSDPATMRDWGEHDQQAVLQHVRMQHPARPLVIVGHSSGGHLTGLAPLTAEAEGLILIASGGCDWRDYPPLQRLRLLAVWLVGMPFVLLLWGHLPSWSGIGHTLPHGVASELRKWSLTRGYLFNDPTLDTSGYEAFAGPLLALSMADDLGYAPPGCVQSLLQKFSSASIEHREIPAAEGFQGRIGHFGFFKSQNASLWPQVIQWLSSRGFATSPRIDY